MLDTHNPNLIIRHKILNGKSEDVVLKNIKFVKKVLPQNTLDYTKNLLHQMTMRR